MKITMYELYGKIYNENPPKHIKVYGEDWYWNDYDGYVTKESLKTTPDAQIYLMDRYRTFMNLDNKVKIIEEPKKLEKIKSNGDEFYSDYVDAWISKSKTDAYCEFLMNKINESIDEINNLKEKKEEQED